MFLMTGAAGHDPDVSLSVNEIRVPSARPQDPPGGAGGPDGDEKHLD